MRAVRSQMQIEVHCPFSSGGAHKEWGGKWVLHHVTWWLKISLEYFRCCSWKTVQCFKEIAPVHCISDKVFTVKRNFYNK